MAPVRVAMGFAMCPALRRNAKDLALLGRRLGAEVERDVLVGGAGFGGPVVIVERVCFLAGQVASAAGGGRAALARLHVQAIRLEGAVGGLAVDVGDVVPDPVGQGVLELGDSSGRAQLGLVGELERDAALARDLIVLAVRATVGLESVHIGGAVGADGPEVYVEVTHVVEAGLRTGLDERNDSSKSRDDNGSELHVDEVVFVAVIARLIMSAKRILRQC